MRAPNRWPAVSVSFSVGVPDFSTPSIPSTPSTPSIPSTPPSPLPDSIFSGIAYNTELAMKKAIGQILLLSTVATFLALARNAVVPGGIPWVGAWATVSVEADSIVPPPSAQKNDPPFLTFAQAQARYQDPAVIFVDAREPEDYAAGHIARALLLPFEQFDTYWPAVEEKLPKDSEIVIYCSGAECELSLFLARHLREIGYTKLSIFYGGWLKWQNEKMPADSGSVAIPAGQGA